MLWTLQILREHVKKAAHLGRVVFTTPNQVIQMHLGDIEALAVGQDGSRPGAEGAWSRTHSPGQLPPADPAPRSGHPIQSSGHPTRYGELPMDSRPPVTWC